MFVLRFVLRFVANLMRCGGGEHVFILDHAGSALMVTGGIAVEVRNVARDRERMFVCGIIVWLHSWRMPCMEGDAVD